MKDLSGQKFGKLKVIKRVENKGKQVCYLCICDCGNYKIIMASHLKSGHTKSCGCITKNRGGLSHTRLYAIYSSMLNRCYNINNSRYKCYGGKGISVCNEWRNNYDNFRSWALNNGYNENAKRGEFTIDRIDVNGNYEPKNCRWITNKEQQNNTTKNMFITYKNKTLTLSEWAEILGIKKSTLWARIRIRKWDIDKAFNK